MMKGKCCKPAKLCPVSLGVALGLTSGLAVMVWTWWAMYYGVASMSLKEGSLFAAWAVLDGLLFGFFLALFYDLIVCCCFKMKQCNSNGNCSCPCCSKEKK